MRGALGRRGGRGGVVSRRIAWSVVVIALVVLAVTLAACGSNDPFSGTWTDSASTKLVIAKANEGWWSIDNVTLGGHHLSYGADIDGELQTANGRSAFKPSGDKLEWRLVPGGTPVELTRQ
jgi:hypothetical protein